MNSAGQGLLVVFEGVDGAGKTTQVKLLAGRLAQSGYGPVITREPGGTRLGEAVRELLLDKRYGSLSVEAEVLLYAAARAQHVTEVIMPALREGKIVLCDRFTDSTLAYQGYGRGVSLPTLEAVNDFAACGVYPDLVLVLDLCPKEGLARIGRTGRAADRMECEEVSFYSRVREGYLDLASRCPGRYRVVDAGRPVEAVHEEIWRIVEEVLGCSS